MSENTKIEWCDHTFNPWEGCQKAGPGCDRCYAEARNARFAGGTAINWGPGAPRRRTSEGNWRMPLKWNKQAVLQQTAWESFKKANPGVSDDALVAKGFIKPRRPRVFCASLGDWADNAVPIQWLVDMLEIVRLTPNLDWLLLTKRIGIVSHRLQQAHAFILDNWPSIDAQPLSWWLNDWLEGDCPPANVWLGATITSQPEADRDIPKLLAVPARVRFLSMEPLLELVDIDTLSRLPCPNATHVVMDPETGAHECCRSCDYTGLSDNWGIDWVIVGGESGPGARPMHPDWARSLRDQCQAAGVPFLFKQWGEWHTAASNGSTGQPVFRQFDCFQQWVNKAPTWVRGGTCLDRHGQQLKNGGDMARARDGGDFPVTIMHKVGKKAAGRLLDGRTWDEVPA